MVKRLIGNIRGPQGPQGEQGIAGGEAIIITIQNSFGALDESYRDLFYKLAKGEEKNEVKIYYDDNTDNYWFTYNYGFADFEDVDVDDDTTINAEWCSVQFSDGTGKKITVGFYMPNEEENYNGTPLNYTSDFNMYSKSNISAGSGLTMTSSGNNKTIQHTSTVTASSVGPTTNTSSRSFVVPRIQYNNTGHIISAGNMSVAVNVVESIFSGFSSEVEQWMPQNSLLLFRCKISFTSNGVSSQVGVTIPWYSPENTYDDEAQLHTICSMRINSDITFRLYYEVTEEEAAYFPVVYGGFDGQASLDIEEIIRVY